MKFQASELTRAFSKFAKANAANLVVGLVGTFVGVFLAFWLDRAQADRDAKHSAFAIINAAVADCDQASAAAEGLLVDWDKQSLPPQQIQSSTWATFLLNPEVLASLRAEEQAAIAQGVFATQRALSSYNMTAAEFQQRNMIGPVLPFPSAGATPDQARIAMQIAQEERREALKAIANRVLDAAEQFEAAQKQVCTALTSSVESVSG